ncbi:MAG: hypothetical protein P3W97_009825 [Tepidimonas sp.]|nr:hypothetical protein [Tepidimonas sp.]
MVFSSLVGAPQAVLGMIAMVMWAEQPCSTSRSVLPSLSVTVPALTARVYPDDISAVG